MPAVLDGPDRFKHSPPREPLPMIDSAPLGAQKSSRRNPRPQAATVAGHGAAIHNHAFRPVELAVSLIIHLILAAALWGLLLLSWAQAAEVIPHAQDKPPGPALSPAEAIAKMTLPEGFT